MNRAFSLVELSIVLVILGLLTGGVLTGQALIRASELRSITTQYNGFVSAIGIFRDKYFALPGDMNNATTFWGTAATCPGDQTTPSTTPATCNGDGNGDIMGNTAPYSEIHRAWQHLANAGLVEGSYTGVRSAATPNYAVAVGVNIPKSKISSVGWGLQRGVDAGGGGWFASSYGNVLEVGNPVPSNWVVGSAFKPEEAWNIDTKLDDGRPGSGRVMTMDSTGEPLCSTTTVASTSVYQITGNWLGCHLIMKTGY